MVKKFSIIIPVKEINNYILESIPIILDLDYPSFEIVILPNELPRITLPLLKNKKIKIIKTDKVSPAIKRDIGARVAGGEYLAFIDDDAYPKRDWLEIANDLFKSQEVVAIGGPAITPKNNTPSQKASGLFFETIFGGGGMSYRYRPAKKSFYVDDFPSVNLIVQRAIFLEIGGFGSEFWPGEDTKFCLELLKRGYKILYSNKLIVYHHRRKLLLPHLRQIGSYGKHRGYFAKKFPRTSLKLVYFVPSLFLLGNLFLFCLSIFSKLFLFIWVCLLFIYFSLVSMDVFVRTSNFKIGFLTIIATFLSHLVYGAMFLKGLMIKKLKSELR